MGRTAGAAFPGAGAAFCLLSRARATPVRLSGSSGLSGLSAGMKKPTRRSALRGRAVEAAWALTDDSLGGAGRGVGFSRRRGGLGEAGTARVGHVGDGTGDLQFGEVAAALRGHGVLAVNGRLAQGRQTGAQPLSPGTVCTELQ